MATQSHEDQIKELELLYEEFEDKFAILKKEQDKIISDFLEEIRKKKIEDIRASINNQ